ncbi:unnamed protein product, partial [Meganyctiphanes norvegica]
VSNGMTGVATMSYNRYNLHVHADKTWFFFDDVILALGSGITLRQNYQTGDSVITTVSQINFVQGNYTIGYQNGTTQTLGLGTYDVEAPSWMYHDHIGYLFLNGNEVLRSNAQRIEHGQFFTDIFTAWLDHGPAPLHASYAYALLPNVNEEATQRYAEDPPIEILAQSSKIHAVCHKPSKNIGAVFRDHTTTLLIKTCDLLETLSITVQHPIIILIEVSEPHMEISVADPRQSLSEVTICLTLGQQERAVVVTLPDNDSNKGSTVTLSVDFS